MLSEQLFCEKKKKKSVMDGSKKERLYEIETDRTQGSSSVVYNLDQGLSVMFRASPTT